ncbi:MAG: hypothetical protein M3O50_04845 [Myxococcota bacterium]|nr:hypothetical protein [Myxococcota bacterium]
MPQAKRRLPVLAAAPDESATPHPFWQWVGFCAASIFAAWLPLCAIVAAVASRLSVNVSGNTAVGWAAAGVLASYAAAIAFGAFAGGVIVGRWGPRSSAVRAAALGGVGATAVAALVSWASFGISAAPWLSAAVAVPAAALGGRLGSRRSKRPPGLPLLPSEH